MTEASDFFADPPGQADQSAPDGDEAAPPDLLSGMLRNVRLRGEEIYCCAPVTPFAISFGHLGGTLHIVNDGKFELQLDGQRHAYRYERGDVILLPARCPHVIRGDGRRVPARPLASSSATTSFAGKPVLGGCLGHSRSTTREAHASCMAFRR